MSLQFQCFNEEINMYYLENSGTKCRKSHEKCQSQHLLKVNSKQENIDGKVCSGNLPGHRAEQRRMKNVSEGKHKTPSPAYHFCNLASLLLSFHLTYFSFRTQRGQKTLHQPYHHSNANLVILPSEVLATTGTIYTRQERKRGKKRK